jgi:hypothetical protein
MPDRVLQPLKHRRHRPRGLLAFAAPCHVVDGPLARFGEGEEDVVSGLPARDDRPIRPAEGVARLRELAAERAFECSPLAFGDGRQGSDSVGSLTAGSGSSLAGGITCA